MEKEPHTVKDKNTLQRQLLRQTLQSWRFFLLFSAPPLIWAVSIASPGAIRFFILLLCGVIWLGCWRLWLDERYFRFLSDTNNIAAGKALAFIWQREVLSAASMIERQRGALKQCRRTMWFTGWLWGIWLLTLLWIK